MPDVKVSVEGLSDLQARLNDLKDKDEKRILNKALRAGGEVFKKEEEQLAPERLVARGSWGGQCHRRFHQPLLSGVGK